MKYEDIKKNLYVSVINEAKVKTQMVRTNVADLCLIYKVEAGDYNFVVTYDMLDAFGITARQIHCDAMENGARIHPPITRTLGGLVSELTGEHVEDRSDILVLTTRSEVGEAAALFYPNVMETIAKIMGGSYYVLPSSIYEMLIVPESIGMSPKELAALVYTVNESEVTEEDRLSYHVYRYDAALFGFGIVE